MHLHVENALDYEVLEAHGAVFSRVVTSIHVCASPVTDWTLAGARPRCRRLLLCFVAQGLENPVDNIKLSRPL